MKIAIYPGSFDPVTLGHIDVIKRALRIFDHVIVAVGENPDKKCMFSVNQRQDMLKEATKGLKVSVEAFSGLLVRFAKQNKASAIIKGLRAVSDFEGELQQALMNRKLDRSIETVFIMTRGRYIYLSSSVVKQVASLGGPLDGLVPKSVIKHFKRQKKVKNTKK